MNSTRIKILLFLFFFFTGTLSCFSAQAAVPVVVLGDWLNDVYEVHDVDDYDPNFYDIESQVIGTRDPTIVPGAGNQHNANVTLTEKFQGSRTEKTQVLSSIQANIANRIQELQEQIREEQSKDDPDEDLIEKYQEAIADLRELSAKTQSLQATLRQSNALDVHVVKDSTDPLEDFKAMAREKLARTQVAEIGEPIKDHYESKIIQNYQDYLYQEAIQAGKDYLEQEYARNNDQFTGSAREMVNQRLTSTWENKYENDDNIDPETVLDPQDNSRTKKEKWRDFLKLNSNKNNPTALAFNAYSHSKDIIQERRDEHRTQSIAFAGLRPTVTEDEEKKSPEGNNKQIIKKPGSLTADERAALTETVLDVAATPEYASEKSAIGALDTRDEETGLIDPAPYEHPQEDVMTSEEAKENYEWWDDTTELSALGLIDVFCTCFPEICDELNLSSILDILDQFGDYDFDMAEPELEICGETFDICDYIPFVCDFLGGFLDLLPFDIFF